MDFMKLLRSFEEFLFEAVSWLVFYPLTLWRIVTRPLGTMAYSDREQAEEGEGRYDDALSPPLMLLITVVLVNMLATALHTQQVPQTSELGRAVFSSPQNLALFRSLIFSLTPLVAAATFLRRRGVRLSRATLGKPFYAQCYLAAPCCIVVSLGTAIFHRADVPNVFGAVLVIAGAAWFLVAQTRWFAAGLGVSRLRAFVIAVWAVARALFYMLLVALPVAYI